MSTPIVRKMPTMRQATGAALVSRVAIVLIGVCSSVLLPLALSQQAVGMFFLAQILIAGLSTAAQVGLTLTVPGAVTTPMARGDLATAAAAARLILAISLIAACLTAVATLVFGPLLVRSLMGPRMSEWIAVIWVTAAIIPFSSQTAVLVEVLRATHAIKAAASLSAFAGCATVLYVGIAVLEHEQRDVIGVLTASAVGSVLSASLGWYLLHRRIANWPKPGSITAGATRLIGVASPNLVSTLILFALSQADSVLLYTWLGPAAVAHYGVAIRLCVLLVMPLALANAALAPIVAELRAHGSLGELQRILRQVAIISTLVAVMLYVALLVTGPWLIELWNPSYRPVYWLALILGVGQVVHAACGAAGMLLMTCGEQLPAMRITMSTGVLTIVLCLGGLHFGGAMGLATASAIGNAIQVIGFTMRVRSRLALEPSVMALVRPPTRWNEAL